ncbi:hypothetical protein WJX81_002975 [Elliptochloris bilobata]|uniref:ATP-dependent DNA helicase n=1 Tax=Elliptochloris bilobata TaxID=381761 RepID=A0AAW1R3Q4_9CHLO
MMAASVKAEEDHAANGNQMLDEGGQSLQDHAGRRTRLKQQPQRALSPAEEKLPELDYAGEPLNLSRFLQNGQGQPVLVHIAAAYMSGQNPKVRARQLWGNIVYTQDSDLVAVLMHNGYYNHSLQQQPASMAEVRAVVLPLPPQPAYTSSARNSIRSRAWGTAVEGFSYRVERCYLVSKSGVVSSLEPGPDGAATVVPTFTPAQFERTLNTRAATSSVERRQRTMNEVTVQYNLCNEPRIKYSMAAVADRGLKPSQWTSARLRAEVLVLETHRTRYELSRNAPPPDTPPDAPHTETYRWARCKEAAPLPRLRCVGLPLPEALLDVLEPALAWEDLQWSQLGVSVRGKLYQVVRLHFAKRQPPLGEDAPFLDSGPVAMKQVSLVLEPPVALTTARIGEGLLSLRFPRTCLYASSGPVCVQVLLSGAEPQQLVALRDALNAALLRAMGRPLKPLEPNVLALQAARGLKRKAHCMSGGSHASGSGWGPAGSACSAGSAGSAGATASSQDVAQQEELAPLSVEQQCVLDLVLSGRSVFFTGCAGTGKSLLLRHIVRRLPPETTFVTASTGLAAAALGGTTLNAFAGIGRADGGREAMRRAASRPEAAGRWRRASALIVDEVSMVDGALLDALEGVARHVRRSDKPFGGLQLILSGDFHQLPPVVRREVASTRAFAFEAACWASCVDASLRLTRVFRQADSGFVDILAEVRAGKFTRAAAAALQQRCSRPLDTSDGILPTKIFTHKADVDDINAQELARCSGERVTFGAQDVGSSEALAACLAPRSLELCVGAQVMLTRNANPRRGLVNGARGVVERFAGTTNRLPVVRFASGEVVTVSKERFTLAAGGRVLAARTQVPLALAWALSVHKSQGATLDRAEISLERAFEPGMAYVALSRVRSLEGLQLTGPINARGLAADPKVLAFYGGLRDAHHFW